jgi:hypothetical protein
MGTQVSFGVNPGEKGCELMKRSESLVQIAMRSNIGRKALRALGATIAVLLLCVPAFSQGSSGRIVGTITDANGGAITGATVTILDTQRGTSRPLTTDETGAYNAPNLTPGSYKVRAEFKGFKITERQNVVLEVGQEVRVDLTLQPGEQAQTITVTEQVPLVETTNAELGGTLQNEVINDLPLNGRNFENLLDLRPGVTKYVGNSGWTQSSNGLRPHDNMFLVEGVNSNDPWMAQSVMNAVMAAGDAGTMLPIDAIDEFKTQQNPRAEYGWKPGATVNVGIKSGTNTIHGSAYAYGRGDAFDARNYFNPDISGKPVCATDPFQCIKTPVELEQYGASVGGPIKKDKLFYFGNFEAQRYSVGNPVEHNVPITNTSAAVTGAGGPVTGLNTNSLIGACLAALPANGGAGVTALSAQLAGMDTSCNQLSNYPGLFPVNNGTTKQLNTSLNSTNKIYSGVGKIDFHINDKHSLSGMYFISPGSGTFVDNPTLQIAPQWLTVQYARSQVGSVGWTYVPNSKWVNSFRFGYSHYYQTFLSADSNQNPASYNFNGQTYDFNTGVTDKGRFGLPEFQWQGGYSFLLGASWPKTVGPDGVWQFSDSVSYLRGNHSFKFGGDVLILQSTNDVTANEKGPVRFGTNNGNPSLQNYFSGIMNRAQFTSGNLLRHLQSQGYGFFVQDDWRVTPRLTMNLGVRYELTTIVKEKNNLEGNFSPTKGLEQVGVGGFSSVYNGDHNNFGPRFGFAWDIGGNGKTVVRGGGSVLYEQGSFDSLMALGNLLGLRTIPTGVALWTGNAITPTTAGGTINVGQTTYTGTSNLASIKASWANNSSTPLYSPTPACGDGNTTIPPTGFGSLSGTTPAPCTIMGVDPNLRTPYITTWSLGIQRALTNDLSLDVTYVGNHGTKLVGLIDLNQPLLGSGWGDPSAGTGTGGGASGSAAYVCLNDFSKGPYTNCSPGAGALPLSKFPYLGFVEWLSNLDVSNYNSLQVSVTQRAVHGLSYVLGYTYSHALGMSPDNWSFVSPTDNAKPRSIYGTTQFDVTHRFTFSTTYALPGMNAPAQLLKGWSLNSIVTLESATPWGINDLSTDFSGTNEINSNSANGEQWNFFGNPADFKTTRAFEGTNGGSGGIPYFPGTSNATCLAKAVALDGGATKGLAQASLTDLGCYVNGSSMLLPPAYGTVGNTSPNMFRGLPYYNVDLNVTKVFKFKERLTAQFRVEFFNLFNRPQIANPYGGPGGSNTYTDPTAAAGASFGFQPATPDVVSSNPVLGSGGNRAMQLGLKILF